MSTVINTNVLALNAHRNLGNISSSQEKSSQRLSSGLRINSAADDAAGLAISEKMRAQIRGLDMATKNAQDAQSLIQTAEGGMQEIDNMLQRVRELTVQASNDTNEHNSTGTGDRQKIQDEINDLVSEIDSMAERTEFNKKKLINGNFAGKASDAIMKDVAEKLATKAAAGIDLKNWKNITANDAKLATLTTAITTTLEGVKTGTTVDGYAGVTPEAKTQFQNVYDKMVKALDMVSTAKSSDDAKAGEDLAKEALAEITKFEAGLTASPDKTAAAAFKAAITTAEGAFTTAGISGVVTALEGAYTTAEADYKTAIDAYKEAPKTAGLFFQVGANSGQSLEISIGSIKSDILGIGDGGGNSTIDVLNATGKNITKTLDTLDTALSYVTTERSKLGAAQNRLDYTMKSLQISSENLSAAESRIRDTDMAKEMMNYTKANVLQQAATSMLAQANQAPQSVLKLLG